MTEIASRETLLGALEEQFVDTLPASFGNVFFGVKNYVNGAVIYIYDLGISRTDPVYVLANTSGLHETLEMEPGSNVFIPAMYFGEALRHVNTALGDA